MAIPDEEHCEREAARAIRDLDDEELSAIQRFARQHGRQWKDRLASVYWYNARVWRGPGSEPHDGAVLHGLRNDPRWNHAGLAKFRLPRTGASHE